MRNKLVHGWGINDVAYPINVYKKVDGKCKSVWCCPYYEDWVKILQRCFDTKLHLRYPTYSDCTVCEEWKYFSNFIKWVDSQPNRDWMNCDLDKDMLLFNNKHYSPDTVVYIPSRLNKFIKDRKVGGKLIGVSKNKHNNTNPYQARCQNPFSNRSENLGYFSTELEAHQAWKAKKHEHACMLAEQQQDPRVAKVLRERYAPDKDWTNK